MKKMVVLIALLMSSCCNVVPDWVGRYYGGMECVPIVTDDCPEHNRTDDAFCCPNECLRWDCECDGPDNPTECSSYCLCPETEARSGEITEPLCP